MDKPPAPQTFHLKDYKAPEYLIDAVSLDVNLHPTATRVRSVLSIRPGPESAAGDHPLTLDGEGLELQEVRLDGQKLEPGDYVLGDRSLAISAAPRRPFELEITTFCNPEANQALSGLYRTRGIFCTQCEAQGFRRITYFLDRPDVLARYRVRIQANRDIAPVLLSNGNPVDEGVVAETGVHWIVWEDPHPKPSYLFALVGGDLACVSDRFMTRSGREVALRIYVEPGKQDRCEWAMESLKKSMRWDEERFGREYDLDIFMIVAVSDFNMGAMENKGLNVFNDKLILALPETATDADYAAIEAVIAHEYFHNWTGNRITCRDWFQLCLKEGLTVFRDQEFTSDIRSRPVKRISDVRMLRTHQFPEDGGPLAHPVRPSSYIEINNFYTATVYEKGAELCRMILTILGEERFASGMDLYFERHDGQAVMVEDFVKAMADASGENLTQFMRWYEQAGTPEVACALSWNRVTRTAELKLSQVTPATPGQPNKKPLHIPIRLGLIGPDGDDMPLVLDDGRDMEDGLLHLRDREQSFRFSGVASRPVPSLLRNFSAPVKLTMSMETDDLRFLMANDSDPFNRWQAGQTYALQLLNDAVARIRGGDSPRPAGDFAAALGATIADESLEPAFRAAVLALPSESDVAREIGSDVDPEAIHTAREQLRVCVARDLRGALVELYETHLPAGSYSPDATSAGKRSLRNAALTMLAAGGEANDPARVDAHYRRAANMTDAIAALAVLSDMAGPERDAAFADFYRRWKDDHLVVDKWFALQAMSALPDVLEQVRALSRHPLFSLKTPNKVRALIGAFASMNPVGFNRPDGAGYAFVADVALEIDGFNPQVAARLMGAFKSWRMLEPGRRERARAELERVVAAGGLSRDTFEIVTRTLE